MGLSLLVYNLAQRHLRSRFIQSQASKIEKSIWSINRATDIAVDISMFSSSSFINDILEQTNFQFDWRALKNSHIFPKYLPQLLSTRLIDINNNISPNYLRNKSIIWLLAWRSGESISMQYRSIYLYLSVGAFVKLLASSIVFLFSWFIL